MTQREISNATSFNSVRNASVNRQR